MAKGLARLFRDYVWKLHRLPESVILDRGLQFAAELMRELNKILGIETKLSIYGLSPRNRWTNGEDKPRAGTVLKNVYQS